MTRPPNDIRLGSKNCEVDWLLAGSTAPRWYGGATTMPATFQQTAGFKQDVLRDVILMCEFLQRSFMLQWSTVENDRVRQSMWRRIRISGNMNAALPCPGETPERRGLVPEDFNAAMSKLPARTDSSCGFVTPVRSDGRQTDCGRSGNANTQAIASKPCSYSTLFHACQCWKVCAQPNTPEK